MSPTLKQISKKYNKKTQYRRNKFPALLKNPQKKVLCLKSDRKTPRKPNSAMRRVAIIGLSERTKKIGLREFIIFIPGDAAPTKNPRGCDPNSKKSQRILINLPIKNNTLLIQGGGPKDLPGVNYKAIRGAGKPKDRPGRRGKTKYNLSEIPDRLYSRSLYGAKKLRIDGDIGKKRYKNTNFPIGQKHIRKEKKERYRNKI